MQHKATTFKVDSVKGGSPPLQAVEGGFKTHLERLIASNEGGRGRNRENREKDEVISIFPPLIVIYVQQDREDRSILPAVPGICTSGPDKERISERS